MDTALAEFRPVFRYTVSNGHAVDTEILDQTLWEQSGAVYARIHEGEVIYIGKTDGTLKKRLKQHVGLIPKQDNDHYRPWAEGKTITVVAYVPPVVTLAGHQFHMHRQLERTLIGAFLPRFVKQKPGAKKASLDVKPGSSRPARRALPPP